MKEIIRYVTIARRSDIHNPDELRSLPGVREVRELPLGFVMYQYHDETYERVFIRKERYHGNAELLAAAQETRRRMDALLGPLHARSTKGNFATQVSFTINDTLYQLATLRQEKHIRLPYFEGVTLPATCTVVVKARPSRVLQRTGFDELIQTWAKWAAEEGNLVQVGTVVFRGGKVQLDLEFSSAPQDAIAVLAVMLDSKHIDLGISEVLYSRCLG